MNLRKKKLYMLIALAAISLGIFIALFNLVSSKLVVANDVTAPVVTLLGDEYCIIPPDGTYVEAGATAMDEVSGDLTNSISIEGTFNPQIYGKQLLIYTVKDSNGNIGKATRTIVSQELIPPQITLVGKSKLYHSVGQEYVDPGFTALDNVDGDITNQVSVTGDFDVNTVGTYTLTYTVSDSSNNITTHTRAVQVFQPQTEEQIANPTEKVVYLTFDDGPTKYTTLLLDILDKYNVSATFFVTNQFSDYQDMIGETYRRGHTIAMHTYSHRFENIYDSEAAYYKDLNKIRAICEAQTGVTPKIIRFPGGTSNVISKNYCSGIMSTLSKSVGKNGYLYCDWNVDSNDAGGAKTAEGVAANVIAGIQKRDRSVVLQHDTHLYSIEAVEEIICWGLSNGYTFLPLTEDSPMVHHRANN